MIRMSITAPRWPSRWHSDWIGKMPTSAILRTLRTPCAHNHLPNLRWRQRQFARLDAEGAQGGRDRIRNHPADRNDTAFACTLGAERIVRSRLLLKRDRTDDGKTVSGRHQVIGKRAGEELTVLVINQMLQKCAAEALYDGADRLAAQHCWIDDATHVLDRNVIDHFDMSGGGIHRHMRRMGAVAVSAMGACKSAVSCQGTFSLKAEASRKLSERHRFASCPGTAFHDLDILRFAAQAPRPRSPDHLAQFRGSRQNGGATHHDGTRAYVPNPSGNRSVEP